MWCGAPYRITIPDDFEADMYEAKNRVFEDASQRGWKTTIDIGLPRSAIYVGEALNDYWMSNLLIRVNWDDGHSDSSHINVIRALKGNRPTDFVRADIGFIELDEGSFISLTEHQNLAGVGDLFFQSLFLRGFTNPRELSEYNMEYPMRPWRVVLVEHKQRLAQVLYDELREELYLAKRDSQYLSEEDKKVLPHKRVLELQAKRVIAREAPFQTLIDVCEPVVTTIEAERSRGRKESF